ncbi:hypothetical protein D9M72_542130 [compost metagenome]
MSSKSKAMDPLVPFSSRRIAFLRPRAKRVASKMPMGPAGLPGTEPASAPSSCLASKRAVNSAASSTVTGPRGPSEPPWPPSPTKSPPTGRSFTNVSSSAETPVMLSPVIHWAASMLWAPMSPRDPDPDLDLSSRHVSGASASLSQSCRYWARTCLISPKRPSSTIRLARASAGVRR